MHPEVEWHITLPLPDFPPDERVVHGREAVRARWERMSEAWEQITLEVEEILHDEGDVLVLQARFRARGKGSGIEVDRPVMYVMDLWEGQLKRIRPFETREQALAQTG